jgi:serine/threonine protein phosphatase PrpC
MCRCGAGPDAIDESGFCTECGIRRGMSQRDHIEMEPVPEFAGVTDKGLRHNENQDDMAIAVADTPKGKCYIAVVCDGVSGSEGAANASAAAAKTACAALTHGVTDSAEGDIEALMRSSIIAANHAVCRLAFAHLSAKDPPETTIVAAVVIGQTVVVGWAGDSRAYWISGSDSAMITRDHSWINDVVDAGQMSEEEAEKAPLAHAIVLCLGGAAGNTDEPVEPSIVTCEIPADAKLLLCSDGLWNYAPTLEELSGLVMQVPVETPRDAARRLVRYAISEGGKDNITAVVLDRANHEMN